MIETGRLILRTWRESDYTPFAALNADPQVMEYFPAPLTREESDALADRIQQHLERAGWGIWAVEEKSTGEFVGFVGLNPVAFPVPGRQESVEVGWRLRRPSWGNGYATEAARASLSFAWDHLGLPEVVSFAVTGNQRSIAVMRRLGMSHVADFHHPRLPPGHALRSHALYAVDRPPVVAGD